MIFRKNLFVIATIVTAVGLSGCSAFIAPVSDSTAAKRDAEFHQLDPEKSYARNIADMMWVSRQISAKDVDPKDFGEKEDSSWGKWALGGVALAFSPSYVRHQLGPAFGILALNQTTPKKPDTVRLLGYVPKEIAQTREEAYDKFTEFLHTAVRQWLDEKKATVIYDSENDSHSEVYGYPGRRAAFLFNGEDFCPTPHNEDGSPVLGSNGKPLGRCQASIEFVLGGLNGFETMGPSWLDPKEPRGWLFAEVVALFKTFANKEPDNFNQWVILQNVARKLPDNCFIYIPAETFAGNYFPPVIAYNKGFYAFVKPIKK